jgi:GH25 family lysozyme M1 (1,4-beta-N-acetylmuramidase)
VNSDTADCAYDYGWNAAAASYPTVEQAYAALAIAANPNATAWWLDVETTNSWRTDTALNVAALQGQADYLTSRGVTRLGFYSTTVQWGTITGGSKVFAPLPSWGAGSPSEKAAKQLCATTATSFTGGRLAMVQYIANGFDVDVRC